MIENAIEDVGCDDGFFFSFFFYLLRDNEVTRLRLRMQVNVSNSLQNTAKNYRPLAGHDMRSM